MPKETLEGEHWRAFRLFLASLEDRELKQVGQQLNRERAVRRECQDSQLRLFFSSLSASDLEVARHTISNERFARAHDRRLVARAVGAAQVSIQIIIGSLALCRGQSDECPDCGSLPRKEKIRMNASEKQDANSSAENTAPKPRSAPHIGSKPEAKASKAKRRRKRFCRGTARDQSGKNCRPAAAVHWRISPGAEESDWLGAALRARLSQRHRKKEDGSPH